MLNGRNIGLFAATMCLGAILLAAPGALAQGVFDRPCEVALDVWVYGRKSVYVIAGIGILVLAVFAFFGRFKWSHLFALAGGVILVAGATQLISWLADGPAGMNC